MRILILPALTLVLAAGACNAEDDMTGLPEAGSAWTLARLDGAAFGARATLTFPEPGQVAGEAPCNSYGGAQLESLPAFRLGPLRATRRACPALADESAYFAALAAMMHAEVQGDTLILSSPDGREMAFDRLQP